VLDNRPCWQGAEKTVGKAVVAENGKVGWGGGKKEVSENKYPISVNVRGEPKKKNKKACRAEGGGGGGGEGGVEFDIRNCPEPKGGNLKKRHKYQLKNWGHATTIYGGVGGERVKPGEKRNVWGKPNFLVVKGEKPLC